MEQATREKLIAEQKARDEQRKKELEALGITEEKLKEAGRQIEMEAMHALYLKFEELKKAWNTSYIYLCFSTVEEAGVRDNHAGWLLDWSNAEKGIEVMQKAIDEAREENQ